MALTKIQAAGLTADLIDETKLADNSIDSEHYNDGSIDNAHLADDAVGVDELSATGTASSSTFLRGDNSWATPTDTNTTYSVGDGGLTTNDFTNADHTKLDGIAASANNYVHPNHTGEVTSTADGATVIADDVVDEANLKVSNAPTNGYFLSAQSGDTGGLTWAEAGGGVTTDSNLNTVIGTDAGDAFDGNNATYNTLVGHSAGTDLTTGDYNTVLGAHALLEGTDANQNIAIGLAALKMSTSAANNVAVGANALREGTDSFEHCVAIGKNASYNNGDADWNVAIGSDALYTATTSPKNVCIGYRAGYNITTGNGKNVYIGHSAGNSGNTGFYNVLVGAESDLSAATGQYQFVFGPISSKGDGTFHVTGTNGAYNQANNSSWSTTSDRRIKKNIVNNNVGLSVINQVQVKNFEYKTLEEIETDDPDLTAKACVVEKSGTQLGVIAQEMESILPSSVVTLSSGAKSVNEDELFWHMLNAIKELSAKVTALESG